MSGFEAAVEAILVSRLDLPSSANELAERFAAAGQELYLVGGAVRDALLERTGHGLDHDFATDATPVQTKEIIEGFADAVWTQGEAFGSIGMRKGDQTYEITTFRVDDYAPASRKPEVSAVADIETDLARRDFTVNSMAVKLPEMRFIDPFGGANDLHLNLLRTPGDPHDSFGDDPLRMLRAARFVSQLGLEPVPELIAAMKQMAARLEIVSSERIRDELIKLLSGKYPHIGIELATETGLCAVFLPELPALKLEQDPIHRHKDVYKHSLAVMDKICDHEPEGPDVTLRLAALLHDIGKPATRRIETDGVSFHHHDVVGARMARDRLQALAFPSEMIDKIYRLIELHLRFHTFRMGWSDSAVRRYARDAGELLDQLNILVRCDCTTRNRRKAAELMQAMDQYEERLEAVRQQEDLDAIRPPLDGHAVMTYLGVGPSRTVGDALAYLLEHRLEHGAYSSDEAYALLDAWALEAKLTDIPRKRTP